MIVFTITNSETGKVYVASSRNAPEARWAQLVNQANNGTEGKLFNEIRYHGENSFTVEEWGFADEPSEIRQLMKEAQQDLGAEPLNISKSDADTTAKRKKLSDRDAKKLLEELERTVEAMSGDDDFPERKSSTPAAANTSSTTSSAAIASKLLAKQTLTLSRRATPEPVAEAPTALPTGRVSSRAKEQQIREKIEHERMIRDSNKSAQIARDSAQMNQVIASIELRRKSMREEAAAKRLAQRRVEQKAAREAKALMARQKQEKEALRQGYSEPATVTRKRTSSASSSVTQLYADVAESPVNQMEIAKPKEPLDVREKRIRDQILLQRAQMLIRQRASSGAPRSI